VTITAAPGFLVAAPSLRCPFFGHSLVLLLDHGEGGTFGFVVNRPADVSFKSIAKQLGMETTTVDAPVMIGGPVSQETGWILFDPESIDLDAVEADEILDGLAVSASKDLLVRMAEGHGPRTSLVIFGYAGWAPGQLESEMREGSWIPVDYDRELVFELPVADRWRAALEKLGIDPARVAAGSGSA
jgi:putative transcriptional regulator